MKDKSNSGAKITCESKCQFRHFYV